MLVDFVGKQPTIGSSSPERSDPGFRGIQIHRTRRRNPMQVHTHTQVGAIPVCVPGG
jgi:hypothetical protein